MAVEQRKIELGFYIAGTFIIVIGLLFALIGNIFLTKVVFQKGKTIQGGLKCFDVSKTDAFFMKAAVVLLWILIPFQIYTLYVKTCELEAGETLECGDAWIRYLFVGILVLEIIGLIALTMFTFKLKKRGDRYCAVLSDTDHNVARVSSIVLWISILYYGGQGIIRLIEYFEKRTPEGKKKEKKETVAEKKKATLLQGDYWDRLLGRGYRPRSIGSFGKRRRRRKSRRMRRYL
jgi:hypothetical protein